MVHNQEGRRHNAIERGATEVRRPDDCWSSLVTGEGECGAVASAGEENCTVEQGIYICCDYIGEPGVAPDDGSLPGSTREVMNEASRTRSAASCAPAAADVDDSSDERAGGSWRMYAYIITRSPLCRESALALPAPHFPVSFSWDKEERRQDIGDRLPWHES